MCVGIDAQRFLKAEKTSTVSELKVTLEKTWANFQPKKLFKVLDRGWESK